MKKLLFFLGLLTANTSADAQDTLATSFNLKFQTALDTSGLALEGEISDLASLLIKSESETQFAKELSPRTRGLIADKVSPFHLQLLKNEIEDNYPDTLSLHMKEKLIEGLGCQTKLLMDANYPGYQYAVKQKQLVKFISIRSGNDLFTLASVVEWIFFPKGKYIGDNSKIFQRNDDRDYTGSFLFEIGTDYLKANSKQPKKSYQTLLFGFDVYTPYFKDTSIFSTDTSFNPKDRPHASFQYVGWSKKAISLSNRRRWATTFKVGKIGGQTGARFQNTLHQDVSYSPRPRGWGAQIADRGRLGFSIEHKHEFHQWHMHRSGTDSTFFKNLFLSPFAEAKLGTYMTNLGVGLQLSNKPYKFNNHNFVNHRLRNHVNSFFENLMYNIAFSATYVKHNTMLEGYGIMSSKEDESDVLTPLSRYYLQPDQIKRVTFLWNTSVSYTTRYGAFFYNWKSFSPETKLSGIGINSPASGKEMNISKRWHHFAEVGFVVRMN